MQVDLYKKRDFIFEQAHSRNTKLGGLPEKQMFVTMATGICLSQI